MDVSGKGPVDVVNSALATRAPEPENQDGQKA